MTTITIDRPSQEIEFGAIVDIQGGVTIVNEIRPKSLLEPTELRVGMQITAINSISIVGMEPSEILQLFNGATGTVTIEATSSQPHLQQEDDTVLDISNDMMNISLDKEADTLNDEAAKITKDVKELPNYVTPIDVPANGDYIHCLLRGKTYIGNQEWESLISEYISKYYDEVDEKYSDNIQRTIARRAIVHEIRTKLVGQGRKLVMKKDNVWYDATTAGNSELAIVAIIRNLLTKMHRIQQYEKHYEGFEERFREFLSNHEDLSSEDLDVSGKDLFDQLMMLLEIDDDRYTIFFNHKATDPLHVADAVVYKPNPNNPAGFDVVKCEIKLSLCRWYGTNHFYCGGGNIFRSDFDKLIVIMVPYSANHDPLQNEKIKNCMIDETSCTHPLSKRLLQWHSWDTSRDCNAP